MSDFPFEYLDGMVARITNGLVGVLQTEVGLKDEEAEELKSEINPPTGELSLLAKTAAGGLSAYFKAVEQDTPTAAMRSILTELSATVDSFEKTPSSESLEPQEQLKILAGPSSSLRELTNEDSQTKIEPDWTTLLGSGNSGTIVYAGKWKDQNVAVKVVLKNGENKQVKREIDALTKIGLHENVLRYFCCHDDVKEHRYFLALELCQATLEKWTENQNCILPANLSKPEALFQAANGLEYLHENGLLHRDLKPTNILISVKDCSATVKLADFGISVLLEGKSSATESCIVGTEMWRPPEVLQYIDDKFSCVGVEAKLNVTKLSRQSDIFPLGLIFYYVLSDRRHPYGDSNWDRSKNILNPTFVPNMTFIPAHFSEYIEIIRQMLSHKPRDRPSASQVLRFLLLLLNLSDFD